MYTDSEKVTEGVLGGVEADNDGEGRTGKGMSFF